MEWAPKFTFFLRDSRLHGWLMWCRDRRTLAAWEAAGRSQPPPPVFKQQLIRNIANCFNTHVLVETGTYLGNTVAASLWTFETIYSIELHGELYERARRRFARFPKVRLRHGDSVHELPRILDELKEPALFWLDAHYSGDSTARAEVDTPILRELQAIAQHAIKKHLILVDDARCFDGGNDYPTIEACRTLATRFWPEHKFSVEDDVIRIIPKELTLAAST